MNKIVLVYPSFSDSEDKREKTLYIDIPLSVAALASQLHGKYEVEIVDERLDKYSDDEITLKLKNVFMVGISAITSYQIVNGLKFAQKVRKYSKEIKIIWGGWHASLMPQETIKHSLVDIVVIGQGEYIISKIADCLKSKDNLSLIPNIIYKSENGSIIKTQQVVFNNLQMTNNVINGYQYLKIDRYIHEGWGNRRVLGYESSRGCPFSCKFCSIGAIFKRKWYGLHAENVYNDIEWLKKNYQIDAVHFFDNNFFVSKKRALSIAEEFEKNKIGIKWDGTVVIHQFLNFSQKEIESFKRSGFYRIIVGVESGDEEVLAKISKKHTNVQVLELVKRCKENGLLPSLSFMAGFPWNPEEDTENTIKLIEKVKNIYNKTEILLFIFSPYLGTPLYKIARYYGIKSTNSLEEWADFTYDKANTPWVSDKLKRKIDRYLSFFGTKEMTSDEQKFYQGFH